MESVKLELRAWHGPTNRMYNITTISFVKEQVFGRSEEGLNISDAMNTFALMRFTGVMDKNGRKIFEGDIVVNDNYHSYGIVVFRPGIFVVAYPDAFIQLSNPRVTVSQRMDLEVKGNVYQHIDLLKGGETVMDEQAQQAQQEADAQAQAQAEAEANAQGQAEAEAQAAEAEVAQEPVAEPAQEEAPAQPEQAAEAPVAEVPAEAPVETPAQPEVVAEQPVEAPAEPAVESQPAEPVAEVAPEAPVAEPAQEVAKELTPRQRAAALIREAIAVLEAEEAQA